MTKTSSNIRWCKRARTSDSWPEARGALLGLQLLDRFQKNVAGDGQTLGTDFVQGVLRRVPVGDFEVDHVDAGNATFQKRKMVVFDGKALVHENRRVAQTSGRVPHQVGE